MNRTILTMFSITIPALLIVAAILFLVGQDLQKQQTMISPVQARENILKNSPLRKDAALPFYLEKTDTLLVERTDRYLVVYQRPFDAFVITILAKPLDGVQKEAEAEFLRLSGGAPESACQLSVRISIPASLDGSSVGQTLPLSWCQQ